MTLKDLLGDKVIDSKGTEYSVEDIAKDVDRVGIYFSAHWCPPCRMFTPQLIKTYNTMKTNGKKFEIIFVSSDRDKKSFEEYFGSMPWKAIPFEDRDRKMTLSEKFDVMGIPTFVIVDKDGKEITKDGRSLVMQDSSGESLLK